MGDVLTRSRQYGRVAQSDRRIAAWAAAAVFPSCRADRYGRSALLQAPAGAADIDEDLLVGVAHVPDGVELRLMKHGDGFTILLENTELMSTLASASEEALATSTCKRLGDRASQQWLIGGYGMGFTLRAALAQLDTDAEVVVAEIVPEIIEWALGPMEGVTAGCLDDSRVMLIKEDVAHLIQAARNAYDAILLDVDNGPEGLTRWRNDRLYSPQGLRDAARALTPGGILAIWSAWPDPTFTARLEAAGFQTVTESIKAHAGDEASQHVLWFARKP